VHIWYLTSGFGARGLGLGSAWAAGSGLESAGAPGQSV
jgi:hypothetical protein